MASQALAPPIPVDVTLSLFGGTDTEISPADLPEGLSPDNQDMIFLPGGANDRPGLHKLFNPSFGAVAVVYHKSYVQPNGDPLTLILTSDGVLRVEDVGNSPGVPTQIAQLPSGMYAHSVSDFGREYIASSDLLHGQAVPLQYDGTNLDRVTMDGPGTAPIVADYDLSFPINASPTGLGMVAAIGINSLAEEGQLVTLVSNPTTIGLTPRIGDAIEIAGATTGYNGTFPIASVSIAPASAGRHVYTIQFINGTAGLAVGSGGTFQFPYAEVFTAANMPFVAGQLVAIAGAGVSGYNGTWPVILASGITEIVVMVGSYALATSGAGTISDAGQLSVGQHQCVQMFLLRTGALTRPSPAFSWASGGGVRAAIADLAIGPSNVVARVLAFSGAGGDNFFTLTAPGVLPNLTGPPTVVQAFIIPDNTSSSAIIDFSDNALFAGIPIDVVGNDLFDQVVLGPVLGFFGYASRLATWGDYNKIENFLNMGFCGGYLSGALGTPLGWTAATSGGTLVNGGSWANGMAWQITGDGSTNPKGQITQPAYQDSFYDAILSALTDYTLRIWAKASAANLSGDIIVDFYSPTAGVLASAVIPISQASTTGGFLQANFSAETPATIPSDTVLRVYESGLNNGSTLLLSEVGIVFTQNPYTGTAKISYVENPEAFAATTGNLGAADDDSPIRCFSLQKNVGMMKTAEAVHEFQDNDQEPDQWPVNALSHSVGALSLRACDPGKFGTGDAAEDWDIIASKNGVYLHVGSDFYKVAQEMSRTEATAPTAVTWDDINWAAEKTVWVKNDLNQRRAYIGAPINGSQTPNVVFVLDYREMDTVAQIAAALPIHITLTGKMKSSDMTRKWSRWNMAAYSGEVLIRPGNARTFYLGGGPNSQGVSFGNLYSLDPAYLTDDDYGQIAPYYFTYAFIDHDQEQMYQLGSARHFYSHISAFITGVGLVTITPYVNSLNNPLAPTSPRQLSKDADGGTALAFDLEWTVCVHAQRCFFLIQVEPLPGTTDVQMQIQKLIVRMSKDPVALFRGSGI
jgi:hypothetical protein